VEKPNWRATVVVNVLGYGLLAASVVVLTLLHGWDGVLSVSAWVGAFVTAALVAALVPLMRRRQRAKRRPPRARGQGVPTLPEPKPLAAPRWQRRR
jgi:hypothetical protein